MNQHRKPALAALILSALLTGIGTAQAETIRIACGSGPSLDHCIEMVKAWGKAHGHTVEAVSTPNDSSAQLALFQQLLAAGSADIDVFLIDVVWPGILGPHLVDLKPYSQGAEDQHFPSIIDNNTVDGKLVAMPWFTDSSLLYYRTDLLEKYGEPVPETWEELTRIAEKVQQAEREAGNDHFWGFVWQGRAYEGLTCDALEWVASHGGGTIVADDGKVTINNPQAVAALEQARQWVGTITPPGVLNYTEEEARGVFQAGNALFMRNWPYAWSLGQAGDSAVAGRIGTAPLPKGGESGRHAATLGGWQLAVSQYSLNKELAAELVMYLTGPEVQKQRALDLSLLPTRPALYEDADILAANPFFTEMQEILPTAVARPSTVTGGKYNQMSSDFFNAVHTVLSGSQSAEASLAGLERSLMRLSRGGRW